MNRIVQERLHEHDRKFSLPQQTAQSQDFNPIEHLLDEIEHLEGRSTSSQLDATVGRTEVNIG